MKRSVLLRDSLLNLAFPTACPFCGRLSGGVIPCAVCKEGVIKATRKTPRIDPSRHSFYAISRAYSAFSYEGIVSTAILRAKGGYRVWYLRELTDLAADHIFGCKPSRRLLAADHEMLVPLSLEYDCIVPVPESGNGRGYWVSGIIARRLGEITGLPVETKALRKIRRTPRQAGLSGEERRTNLIGAFGVVRPDRVEGKRILLVDDIITTGSTVSCCAVPLLKAGVSEVIALSLAAVEHEKG